MNHAHVTSGKELWACGQREELRKAHVPVSLRKCYKGHVQSQGEGRTERGQDRMAKASRHNIRAHLDSEGMGQVHGRALSRGGRCNFHRIPWAAVLKNLTREHRWAQGPCRNPGESRWHPGPGQWPWVWREVGFWFYFEDGVIKYPDGPA